MAAIRAPAAAETPEAPASPPEFPSPLPAELAELWRALGSHSATNWELHRTTAKTNQHILIALASLLVLLVVLDKEIQTLTKAVKALQG